MGVRWFHTSLASVSWATSSIRQYLNNAFFNTFTPSERARILETNLINHNNPWDWSESGGHVRTSGGANTTDRIFLLSIDEVLRYFGDSSLTVRGAGMGANERLANEPDWPALGAYHWGIHDQFNQARVARNAAGSDMWWWLRSPGDMPHFVASIHYDGQIYLRGNDVFMPGATGGGVRPALWLSIAGVQS